LFRLPVEGRKEVGRRSQRAEEWAKVNEQVKKLGGFHHQE
jgi:hypothetical protein